jgi:hypothetical protein
MTAMLRFMRGFVVLLSLVTVTYAGGWEIVTLKDFPDFAVAGKPLNLTFTVRVSLEPLADLQPNIRATFCPSPCSTGLATNDVPVANARAKASAATGEYTAVLILPEPGDWVITIDTDLAGASVLPPLKVIFPGTPVPTPFLPAARGLRLFTAKGCYGCHFHEEVNGGRAYGPDMTGKRFAPEYLKKFLADPSITPVPEMVCSRSVCGSPYPMPNLNLKDAEIEALIAFINKK